MLARLLKQLFKRGSAAPPVAMRYRPEVFDVTDENAARRIILTPEGGESTESRWERETPYVVQRALETLQITANSQVIDYGCGIGRIAKGLIESRGCRVLGVDISASMRELALRHVAAARFDTCAPAVLDARVGDGFRADAAIACWVLQHCVAPAEDIDRLHRSLRPGGRFLVLNSTRRAVPSARGWIDDGVDIAALLAARFRELSKSRLPLTATSALIADRTFLAVYARV